MFSQQDYVLEFSKPDMARSIPDRSLESRPTGEISGQIWRLKVKISSFWLTLIGHDLIAYSVTKSAPKKCHKKGSEKVPRKSSTKKMWLNETWLQRPQLRCPLVSLGSELDIVPGQASKNLSLSPTCSKIYFKCQEIYINLCLFLQLAPKFKFTSIFFISFSNLLQNLLLMPRNLHQSVSLSSTCSQIYF